MLEKHIEEHLRLQYLKHGGIAYKFTSPSRRSVPDRLCVLPLKVSKQFMLPKVLFVECKATGKLPTPSQLREHRKLKDLGEHVIVIDSKEQVDLLFNPSSAELWRKFI